MAIHDWTRAGADTFRHFHSAWITHLSEGLNGGMLPDGFYAMAEQHASDSTRLRNLPAPEQGTVAVADAPPRAARKVVLSPTLNGRRKTLTIRHTNGHRIVALIEILSTANKAGEMSVAEFVRKAEEALRAGIHLVVIDLLPPGKHDPQGMHDRIFQALGGDPYELPAAHLLTFAAYDADTPTVAYLEHPTIGEPVPDLPLFLSPERYINLPLGATYETAYRGVPAFWRDVIEGLRQHEPEA